MSLKKNGKYFPVKFANGGKNVATINSLKLSGSVNITLGSSKKGMGTQKRKPHPNWTSIIRKPDSAKTFVKK
jgi:hypothetical protein